MSPPARGRPDPGPRTTGRLLFPGVLVLGLIVHLVATFLWMRNGGFFERPPAEDAALFRMHAELFLDRGQSGGVLGIVGEGLRYPHFHPPVFSLAIALTSYLCNAPPEGVVLWIPTALFGALFVLGAAMIFKSLVAPSHRALAAVVLLGAPGFIVYLRPAMSQMPMTALMLMCIGHLLASRWCTRFGHVALAGVFAGLAMLTKSLALIELSTFAGAYLLASLIKSPASRKRTLGAIPLFVLPVAVIALPWYVENWSDLSNYARTVTDPEGQAYWSAKVANRTLERWTAYPGYFVRYCVGLPAAVIAGAIGVAALVARVKGTTPRPFWHDAPALLCLVVTVIASWVVLTIGQVFANAYFIVQWIPAWAVVLAGLVRGLPSRLAKPASVLVVLSSVSMGALSYWSFQDPGPIVQVGGYPVVDQFDARCLTKIARTSQCREAPDVERWPVAAFVEAAAKWTGRPEAVIGMVCAGNEFPRHLEFSNVNYESTRRGLGVSLKYFELNSARTEFDWVKSVLPSRRGRVGIDVERLSVTSADRLAEDLKPLFESIDVLCFEPKAGSVEQMIGLALRDGFRAEVLLDAPVTDRWHFVLIGLRRAP